MKKILVIEDEPEMRRNITTLLRYHDYDPVAAENGRKGVDAARRENPDLILCDVMMPELDGYGVLQALQTDAALARTPGACANASSISPSSTRYPRPFT